MRFGFQVSLPFIIFSALLACHSPMRTAADEILALPATISENTCGHRALKLVLSVFNESISVNELIDELGSEAISVREMSQFLTRRGYVVEVSRTGGDSCENDLSAIASGPHCRIGIALIGARPGEVGHYFVLYRGPTGEVVQTDALTGRTKVIERSGQSSETFVLLLISKGSISPRTLAMATWSIGVLAFAAAIVFLRTALFRRNFGTIVASISAILFLCWALLGNPKVASEQLPKDTSKQELPPPTPQPQAAQIEYRTIDVSLDDIVVNSPKVFSFSIENNSSSVARYEEFGVSCSCVKVASGDASVLPGESYHGTGELTVSHPGKFMQHVFCRQKTAASDAAIQVTLKGVATDGVYLKSNALHLGPISSFDENDCATEIVEIPAICAGSAIKCRDVRLSESEKFISVALRNDNTEAEDAKFSNALVTIRRHTPATYETELQCGFDFQGRLVYLPLHLQVSVLTSPELTPNILLLTPGVPSTCWLRVPKDFDRLPLQLLSSEEGTPAVTADFSTLENGATSDAIKVYRIDVSMLDSVRPSADKSGIQHFRSAILDRDGKELADLKLIFY